MEPYVSVRELQKHLRRVLARVEHGQTLEVRRRRRAVAVLVPTRRPAEPWPDLDQRAREVLGDRVLSPSPSTLVIEDRGDR